MKRLLCDYGEVLCTAQPHSVKDGLVRLAGLDETLFWQSYWEHRPPYDRGDLTAAAYWASVLGSRPTATQLDELIALDVSGWLHPNHPMIAAANRAAERGYRLAILSNAPVEVADAVDAVPWSAAFDPRIFSCRLRLSKPDPAIFHEAIAILASPPQDIIYFDDRPDNVAIAGILGLQAHLFTGPDQVDALPPL